MSLIPATTTNEQANNQQQRDLEKKWKVIK
jgi:hypothetical protein